MAFSNFQQQVTVDVGLLGSYTVAEGRGMTVWNAEGWEFYPGAWYRAAPGLAQDNSPGVSIVITDRGDVTNRWGEALWIDDNGVNMALTVYNNGKGNAVVDFQYLTAPTAYPL